jgi:hypothetical protein
VGKTIEVRVLATTFAFRDQIYGPLSRLAQESPARVGAGSPFSGCESHGKPNPVRAVSNKQ